MAGSSSFSVRTANLLAGAGMVRSGGDQGQGLAAVTDAAAQTPAAGAWESLVGHASSADHQAASAVTSLGGSMKTAAVAYSLAESANQQSFDG